MSGTSRTSARHRAIRATKRLGFRGRVGVIGAVTSLLLVSGGLAYASAVDESIVDATAPTGSVTLTAGASGSITINLSVTGNQDGTATFAVYKTWTLTGGSFVGSNPETFTVSPRAAQDPATTFTKTGTVTVAAGQSSGTFALQVGAFGITNTNQTGAKLSLGSSSNYAVTVEAPAPPSDTTAPVIDYVLSPATPDGSNDWYKSDVTLTWTVTENESPGSLQTTGCEDQTITVDQQETTYSCSASSDGGTADQVDVKIKRDATAPEVSLVDGPADGGTYYWGFVPDKPTCTASDATSGLTGTSDCTVSGYSDAIGSHTVTANAADNAGNTNTDSATYEVKAWTLSGFYAPVDLHGVLNTVKGGSTVPLKFEIFAGTSELTDTSYIDSFKTWKIACDGSAPTDSVEIVSTGGTSLRYDTTSGQFIQNWKTPTGANQCYRAVMTTKDGNSISADFKLK